MRHIITRKNNRIEIRLLGIGEDGATIVKKFGGNCAGEDACDPRRYSTLEAIRATQIPDGITLEVSARPNVSLDVDEVESCLDAAVDRILANKDAEEITI